jgi:hypothetical protein
MSSYVILEVGREASYEHLYLASHGSVGFICNPLESDMENNGIKIFLLMDGTNPVEAYRDKALADRDCWLCNDAEKFSPDPMPYWVKPLTFHMEVFRDSIPEEV